jgi:Glycosyl transferase family 2
VTSIALCGIVKDEMQAIVEWLAHCKALGFTDFLIYDNECTDGTGEVLRALDAAGELIHANTHLHDQRRERLDAVLAAYDAGGVRNDDLAQRSGPMRAEAMRLCDILRAAGQSFPVWTFVEEQSP